MSSNEANAKRRPTPKQAAPQPGAQPQVVRHPDEAVASILARDAYARERHYLLMRVVTVLGVLLAVSLVMNVLLAMRPVQMRYFATDSDGRIKELVALDRPVQTLPELSNWVAEAISQAYTFSFANYRQELSAARANFTPAGWQGFEKALQESGNLKAVVENKYVATAVPTGAPVLTSQGIVDGRYAWRFEVPMLVTYQSAAARTTQNLLVTAIVVRQPETEHPRGLGVASLVAK